MNLFNFLKKKSKKENSLSVVIGVRNRDKYLKHCLYSLLNQSLAKKKYEIIVVNYGGKKSTYKLINSFKSKNIKYIYTNEKGKFNESRAKNIGIKNSKGDIICCTNADVLFPYDTLLYILNKHKNRDKMILQLQRIDIKRNVKWKHLLYPENKLSELYKLDYNSITPKNKLWAGECMSAMKNKLFEVKGFNEIIEGWGALDREIFVRLEENGLKRVFIDKVVVFHQFHTNKIKAPVSKYQKSWGEYGKKYSKAEIAAGKRYRQKTVNAWKETKEWGVIKE